MGANYVKAMLEYSETYSLAVLRKREKFTVRFIREMVDARPEDVVVLFEDEMSIARSHNGGYGWAFGQEAHTKAATALV